MSMPLLRTGKRLGKFLSGQIGKPRRSLRLSCEVPVTQSSLTFSLTVRQPRFGVIGLTLDPDHDKLNEQNWKEWNDGDGSSPLAWDSGLAWLHGPNGQDRTCKNLLCGPLAWREAEENTSEDNCHKICRFHGETIRFLRKCASGDGPSLGDLLDQSLQQEALYPVFQYGEFTKTNSENHKVISNIVHFLPKNFYKGLDTRVSLLLSHVDRCVTSFTEDSVFL
jgi:hypothetical protein